MHVAGKCTTRPGIHPAPKKTVRAGGGEVLASRDACGVAANCVPCSKKPVARHVGSPWRGSNRCPGCLPDPESLLHQQSWKRSAEEDRSRKMPLFSEMGQYMYEHTV